MGFGGLVSFRPSLGNDTGLIIYIPITLRHSFRVLNTATVAGTWSVMTESGPTSWRV